MRQYGPAERAKRLIIEVSSAVTQAEFHCTNSHGKRFLRENLTIHARTLERVAVQDQLGPKRLLGEPSSLSLVLFCHVRLAESVSPFSISCFFLFPQFFCFRNHVPLTTASLTAVRNDCKTLKSQFSAGLFLYKGRAAIDRKPIERRERPQTVHFS